MAKESKSVRLSENVIEYVSNYPTAYHGVTDFNPKLEECLTASERLHLITKEELKNYFTKEEASLLIDVTNSHLYQPISPKSSLLLCVQDGDFYEGLGEKWEVDIKKLLEKISKLTEYQSHCVFLMCNEFWGLDDETRNKDFNKSLRYIFRIGD
jgi:hypothetical protein